MATTKAYELAQLGNDLTVDSAGNLIFDTTIDVDYNGFDSDFGLKSTSNLTEGSNLYFTDARVETAGALMDTEVSNLAEVKAFAASDYATAAQGTTADAALPKAGGAMTGAITTNSTFAGRNVATDGTKLDGIETAATADQTDAEIRTAVEAATNSNVFTDADHTKLDGIETAATADQTKADIEGLGIELPAANLTGTVAAARLSTATTQAESDDSTKIATTAYVAAKITTLIGGAPSTLNDLNELAAAINDDANYNTTLTTALATKLPLAGGAMTGAITTNSTFDGRDVATDGTKLDTIETSATADQTDAQIRARVEAATDSNVFTDADHSKLNAIEASATADQTDAQIRARVAAATDSNVFTDADHTKLGTIETNAKDDQTITAGTGLTGGGTGNVTVTLNPAISATSLTLTGGVTAAPASSLVVYNSGGTAVKTVHGITST